MQYFGVPRCPYCKKRVNLVRSWTLKKQGEYKCPRCEGISNIFLSSLIYVFAAIAVFTGAAIYFFHRYILNDIGLTTAIQVIIPFAIFFVLSLFMVYLEKPVIKTVKRKRRRGPQGQPNPQRAAAGQNAAAMGRRPSGGEMPRGQTEAIPRKKAAAMPQKIHAPSMSDTGKKDFLFNDDDYISKGNAVVPINTGSVTMPKPAVTGNLPTVPQKLPAQRPEIRPPVTPKNTDSGGQRTVQKVTLQEDVFQKYENQDFINSKFKEKDEDVFSKYEDPDYVQRRLKDLKEK